MGARTPPLRGSSRDVAGGAGLRPAASGESERRADSTLLQREGIWVLSFCWRGFAGEGRPRCTNSRRPSGSTLLLPTFYPFTDVPGREAGPGLCVCDTCISLEPSFSPIPYVYLAFQMFLFIRLFSPGKAHSTWKLETGFRPWPYHSFVKVPEPQFSPQSFCLASSGFEDQYDPEE